MTSVPSIPAAGAYHLAIVCNRAVRVCACTNYLPASSERAESSNVTRPGAGQFTLRCRPRLGAGIRVAAVPQCWCRRRRGTRSPAKTLALHASPAAAAFSERPPPPPPCVARSLDRQDRTGQNASRRSVGRGARLLDDARCPPPEMPTGVALLGKRRCGRRSPRCVSASASARLLPAGERQRRGEAPRARCPGLASAPRGAQHAWLASNPEFDCAMCVRAAACGVLPMNICSSSCRPPQSQCSREGERACRHGSKSGNPGLGWAGLAGWLAGHTIHGAALLVPFIPPPKFKLVPCATTQPAQPSSQCARALSALASSITLLLRLASSTNTPTHKRTRLCTLQASSTTRAHTRTNARTYLPCCRLWLRPARPPARAPRSTRLAHGRPARARCLARAHRALSLLPAACPLGPPSAPGSRS